MSTDALEAEWLSSIGFELNRVIATLLVVAWMGIWMTIVRQHLRSGDPV